MTASAAVSWRRGDTRRLPEVTLFCGLGRPERQEISFVTARRQSHSETEGWWGLCVCLCGRFRQFFVSLGIFFFNYCLQVVIRLQPL